MWIMLLRSEVCSFQAGEPEFGYVLGDHLETGLPGLKSLLEELIRTQRNGILICNSISVAIVANNNCLGVFDSHSRDADGKKVSDGVACYISRESVQEIFQILHDNFGTISEEEIAEKLRRHEDLPSDLNQFQFVPCRVQVAPIASQEMVNEEPLIENNAQAEIERLRKEAAEIENHNLVTDSRQNHPQKKNLQQKHPEIEKIKSTDLNTILNMHHLMEELHKTYDDHDSTLS